MKLPLCSLFYSVSQIRKMTPSVKLIGGAFVVAATIGYLAYIGAANSWQYYLTVDEVATDAIGLTGARIRVSGRVAPGSLQISQGRRSAEFDLVGATTMIHVSCRCAMPDNLADDMDVVVEGVWQTDCVQGHKVITRCASKYEQKVPVAAHVQSPNAARRR
jgi:cytochrome c-type biogenesis protein CcmE